MLAKHQMQRRVARAAVLLGMMMCLIVMPYTEAFGWVRALVDLAQSVYVTTTADTLDGDIRSLSSLTSNPGPDQAISLREALVAANATPPSDRIVIGFALQTSDPGYDTGSASWTIALRQALPPLTRGSITIDGATQPSAGDRPSIVLDGYNVFEDSGLNNGLTISSFGNVVRGLTIMNFYDDGILIEGANSADNQVLGCYIGIDPQGLSRRPNYFGIEIRGGAHGNTIGSTEIGAGNLIAGNEHSGVFIHGASTTNNIVTGNWIGLNADGSQRLANLFAGVMLAGQTHHNTIGDPIMGNVISGNARGVHIEASHDNQIVGNIIGLDPDGQQPIGNTEGGVFLTNGAHHNIIGGNADGAGNLISSNGDSENPTAPGGQGIYIADAGSDDNRIQGNFIGVDISGILPRGNLRQGILIGHAAEHNTVGGSEEGSGNVITYNGLGGVRIDSSANQVTGNLIGVGVDWMTPLGNQHNGVRIGGDNNVIGPDNWIAHNGGSGILTSGLNTAVFSNTLTSNAYAGLLIENSAARVFGNTVRDNSHVGICVKGPETQIVDNHIIYNGGAVSNWADCALQGGVVISQTNNTLVSNNVIHENDGAGISVHAGRANRILTNSISSNTLIGIQLSGGGNDGIAPPTLQVSGTTTIVGMGCPSCRIEIFTDTDNQGRSFIAETIANLDGTFSVALPLSRPSDPRATATQTDTSGNTSPFAEPVILPINQVPKIVYLPLIVR